MNLNYKAVSVKFDEGTGHYNVSFRPISGPQNIRGIGTVIFFHIRAAQRYSENIQFDVMVREDDSLSFSPISSSSKAEEIQRSLISFLVSIGIDTQAIATTVVVIPIKSKPAKTTVSKQPLTA